MERPCTFPVGPDDEARLAFLESLGILDSPNSERFDRLTSMLRHMMNVPIALVSLVDRKRQWFRSNLGLNVFETHRNESFCGHAILPGAPDVTVVHDAQLDERFKDNLLVTGPPFIRFYAGVPIKLKHRNEVCDLVIASTNSNSFENQIACSGFFYRYRVCY